MKKHTVTTRALALALGATPLLLALPSQAGASGAPIVSVSQADTPSALAVTSSLPSTKISGSPAHFAPTALTATAAATGDTCSMADASFSVKNKESSSEVVKVKGTDGLMPFKFTAPADSNNFVCVSMGYAGTMTLKLADANKATVTF